VLTPLTRQDPVPRFGPAPGLPAIPGGYVLCVTTFTVAADVGGPWAVQPRALIVTIYGLYARDRDGWLSVASLIRLMDGLGVDEPAVRSSISRLKQRGVLEPRRDAGSAGYALSRRGRDILAEGDQRIFERPRARLADGWVLAVFSVPEPERRRRHELRSRLTWLGFGTVANGVWIAPAHLAAETAAVLERGGLDDYVTLFRADYQAFGDLTGQVGRWWDLGRLQQAYQAFLDAAGPVLARLDEAAPGAAFADYIRALTAWRRLPFLDPGLPAELLPDGWNGLAADRAFAALRQRLADPARAHVLAVTGVSQ
jgi:phenylacetic acid degradation operon negative regulatory protein